jgi:DNA-binding HxlR family transcriptional regulator
VQITRNSSEKPLLPAVQMKTCPIESSLGVLGRKWTFLILRDIGFAKTERFNQILQITPGLTPRVLSMRLHDLEVTGFIKRIEEHRSPKLIRWTLTEKGKDTLPIMMKLTEFGAKWNADKVFEDKKPRSLRQLFPQRQSCQYF